MTGHDDAELRDLLTDAVSDVEPAYRLDTIRARTRRPHPRRTWLTVGGAVLVAASVITAVNLANDGDRPRKTPTAKDPGAVTALYFVGDTPAGPRLYREFQQVSGGPLGALEAITKEHRPTDPDYSTIWPEDLFTSVRVTENAIEVELGEWTGPDYDISRDAVTAYLQAVVYTAQSATGQDDLPIQFTENGEPTGDPMDTFPGTGPIQRLPQNEILSLVSISDPAEGTVISTDSFVARGRANSFEATVPWQIRTDRGVVKEGFATATGTVDRLYPWETTIDVSDLDPGHYEFVAMTDDPSDGAEGFGPFTDTRTIIVE